MGNAQEISVADMKGADIVFKGPPLRFIHIIYPHDPLQGRCLLINERVFFVDQFRTFAAILKM